MSAGDPRVDMGWGEDAGVTDTTEMGREFRWRFHDDAVGWKWSRWHATVGPCSVCCCGGGPVGGEHQEPAEHYDEGGILSSFGHVYFDPFDVDEAAGREVEWRWTMTRFGPGRPNVRFCASAEA